MKICCFTTSLKIVSYFMRITESYNTLIIMNTDILSEYVEKRRIVIYTQYQIMMIEYVAFKKCQQDTDILTAIEITQYEL